MNQPETRTSLFHRLRFVLVETSHPGNVGAVARAMKTMGFSRLYLVNPRFSDVAQQEEAIAFASGAQDVLAAAKVVTTIEEALEGSNFAAALTARPREFSPPVMTPRLLAADVAARPGMEAAFVFGSERYGLPNDIIEKCNVLIHIPANPEYSSLNLAQAVQLLAYEARLASIGDTLPGTAVGFHGQTADLAQVDGMYAHLEEALITIGFLDPSNPKKLMPRLRRLFSRTQLETEEVNILRGIARHILLKEKQKK